MDRRLKRLLWVVILSPLLMFLVDVFHWAPDQFLRGITGGGFQDTHFSGSDWFSVIATLLTAIPASLFGLVALQQTDRLHKLEDRYHRPMLAVHFASIEEVWLANSLYLEGEYLRYGYPTNAYMDLISKGNLDGCCHLKDYVKLHLEIAITNQIPVTYMCVNTLKFEFSNRSWRLQLGERQEDIGVRNMSGFGTDMRDGLSLVVMDIVLHPFKITGVPNGADESEFADDLFKFMCYEQNRAEGYDRMGITAEMSIDYEFEDDGAQSLGCHMMWKVGEGKTEAEGRLGAFSRRSTANGYFKYID